MSNTNNPRGKYMTSQPTASRRRLRAVAAVSALGVSGMLAAAGTATASTDTTEPAADGTAPADTAAEGTAAEGTAAEGTAAAGGSLPGEGIEIAFIQGVIGDGFYISMECGVQDAADALGASVNVQGPDAFDATLQNPIIDAVVASGPDAILVAPNDVEASAGPLAAGAGRRGSRSSSSTRPSTTNRSVHHGSPRTTSRAG